MLVPLTSDAEKRRRTKTTKKRTVCAVYVCARVLVERFCFRSKNENVGGGGGGAYRESGLRNEVFATFSNSTSDIHSSRCVFEGFSNTRTLQWTSNYIRRLLPRHAVFENKTWEGAEIFTNSLSWELIDDYSNGMMLLEFNKMPKSAEHRSVFEAVPFWII